MLQTAKSTSRGVLLTCDIPTKQFILHVAKQHVLHDLDETHLFIDPVGLKEIQDRVKQFADENAYTEPEKN